MDLHNLHSSAKILMGKHMSHMYIMMAIRSFAVSFLGLFTPIILLQNGYSYNELFGYYFAVASFSLISFLLSVKLVHTIGVRLTILLSLLPQVAVNVLLMFTSYIHISALAIGTLSGLINGLFWYACHVQFLYHANKKHVGYQVGFIQGVEIFAGMIGPLFGGLILAFGGKVLLLTIGVVLSCLAVIPLAHNTKHEDLHPYVESKTPSIGVPFIVEGIMHYGSMLYPIYIFISGITVLFIGILYSGFKLVQSVISIIVGELSDEKKGPTLIHAGATIQSVLFFFRAFSTNPVLLGALSVVGDIGATIFGASFMHSWMAKSKELGTSYVIFREKWVYVGRFLLILLVWFCYVITGNIITALSSGFVLAGVSALLLWKEFPKEK